MYYFVITGTLKSVIEFDIERINSRNCTINGGLNIKRYTVIFQYAVIFIALFGHYLSSLYFFQVHPFRMMN